MRCPHCQVGVHLESKEEIYEINDPAEGKLGVLLLHGCCPECSRLIVILRHGECRWRDNRLELLETEKEEVLFPKHPTRLSDPSIPVHYRNDFNEANAVLDLSPKASAALSRRLLQRFIREEYSIKGTLEDEIEKFRALPEIPEEVSKSVDAVRVVGNFAAHPQKSKNTGEIVEVDKDEADWLLEVIEQLLLFRFVESKKKKERKDKLEQKLSKYGKPPLKK